jgi:uncharacterized protein YecE (DUF72 family)
MTYAVGTAGWSIPRPIADQFPSEGSALERYAARLPVAEINSSFHRTHRISTWERRRDSVPPTFRFSAKLPKTITHQAKLRDCAELVAEFLVQAHTLREKLRIVLVQLPPKLEFYAELARAFFSDLKSRTPAPLACEPRNMSWFAKDADALLDELSVARVAADPALCEAAAHPGGSRRVSYWRLHGSPTIYRSSYADRINEIARFMRAHGVAENWCIFDNTASSAATADALALIQQPAASSG